MLSKTIMVMMMMSMMMKLMGVDGECSTGMLLHPEVESFYDGDGDDDEGGKDDDEGGE